MNKTPVTFIVDDAGPVNLYCYHDPDTSHELLVGEAFLKEFSRVCRRNHVMGKFSFVPIPAGLGRIDGKVEKVPDTSVKEYIRITKEEIEPYFSITPELLTHYKAYDLTSRTCKNVLENAFVAEADDEEIAAYISLALEILQNVGLDPSGVTSPWNTGFTNEENYAKGIGKAFRRVMHKDECFYFLHSRETLKLPKVMYDMPETGKVVSVPCNTIDPFWETQNPVSGAQAIENVRSAVDSLLSADGKTGTMRELADNGEPIIFLSHWQSLFSDGRKIGLEGLEILTARMNKVFGDSIEWMPMAELAERMTK